MISYTETQIRTARALLETLEVKGYDNCKRVVMLRQILDSGEKENEDGEDHRDGD